ncbi:cytochrome C oxidase subunit IV family protein [Peribacillus butanolivorans]|uniref:hypothetical protein n=1 Tax=Peribacillus butanolivorans TaxID=421767 RepID=UPI000AD701AE|nr:hypothetical protein [Peribacillus butanolivorans]
MKQLFPRGHVMGFIFSMVLTSVALGVDVYDLSLRTGMIVLIVASFLQAGEQLD